LALAEELATSPEKSLTLKRGAVSTAYYAVFHALAQLCANELLGLRSGGARSEEYERVYRSLEHGTLKRAFREEPLRQVSALERIGNRVAELQSERIRSDYLPSRALYTRDQCLDLVRSAQSAVRSIGALAASDRRTLAIYLLFKNRPS
jgi:hypothetical protein